MFGTRRLGLGAEGRATWDACRQPKQSEPDKTTQKDKQHSWLRDSVTTVVVLATASLSLSNLVHILDASFRTRCIFPPLAGLVTLLFLFEELELEGNETSHRAGALTGHERTIGREGAWSNTYSMSTSLWVYPAKPRSS